MNQIIMLGLALLGIGIVKEVTTRKSGQGQAATPAPAAPVEPPPGGDILQGEKEESTVTPAIITGNADDVENGTGHDAGGDTDSGTLGDDHKASAE